MTYITHKRFKEISRSGKVNIPYGTILEEDENTIFLNGKPICFATSENAHQYFSRNDDGQGLTRGKLTQEIQKTLQKKDRNHQKRWDKVWDDSLCQKYKRPEYADFWLWNHAFFNAPIEDLEHILSIIKEVA